jgi:hypothetical protein
MSTEQQWETEEWEALRQAMLSSNARLPGPSPIVLQRALAQINAPAAYVAPATVPGNPPPEMAAVQGTGGWQRHPLAGLLLLMRCQIPLIGQSIWAASAIVLVVGTLVAFLFNRAGNPAPDLLALAAPIVAAVGIALVYGPEHDPATELECATPTSPALILLARLVLVYSYDLLLTLATSALLWLFAGHITFSGLILSWLTPMLFLSALALALSVLWNSQGAIIIAFGLWGLRVLLLTHDRGMLADVADFFGALWSNQTLLCLLAVMCVGLAFLRVLRQEQRYA